MQGPNVKNLIIHRMSVLMIPLGTKDGLAAGIRSLLGQGKVPKIAREATVWVELAIQAVRDAADPNPWRDKDDETIAGEILRGVEERLRGTN